MDDDEVESSFNINVTAEVQRKSVSVVFDGIVSIDHMIRRICLGHQNPPKRTMLSRYS
jgi:hypothetical protein